MSSNSCNTEDIEFGDRTKDTSPRVLTEDPESIEFGDIRGESVGMKIECVIKVTMAVLDADEPGGKLLLISLTERARHITDEQAVRVIEEERRWSEFTLGPNTRDQTFSHIDTPRGINIKKLQVGDALELTGRVKAKCVAKISVMGDYFRHTSSTKLATMCALKGADSLPREQIFGILEEEKKYQEAGMP